MIELVGGLTCTGMRPMLRRLGRRVSGVVVGMFGVVAVDGLGLSLSLWWWWLLLMIL